MNRNQRANLKGTMQGGAMLGALVGTVLFCMWWFPKVDCNTGLQGRDFINACEANAHCSLRPRELQLKETYERMIIRNCPKD